MMPAVDLKARRSRLTPAFPSLEDTVTLGRLSARTLWLPVLALVLVAGLLARPAAADEQRVSRLGLAISAMVTSLSPDLVNDNIKLVNRWADGYRQGVASIDEIKAAPFFQAEARFFVSDKIVAVAGVGKIDKKSELELLPTPSSVVLQVGRIRGVTRHLGLDYYFFPYTRGDFTMRPFVGGGFMDVVEARGKVGYEVTDSDTLVEGEFGRARGAGPGFYLEGGVHLMLPSRYSFIINAHYRHVKAQPLRIEDGQGVVNGYLVNADTGALENLDFSGFGLRFAINVNIWNKF